MSQHFLNFLRKGELCCPNAVTKQNNYLCFSGNWGAGTCLILLTKQSYIKDSYLIIIVSNWNNLQEFVEPEMVLQVLHSTHFLKDQNQRNAFYCLL